MKKYLVLYRSTMRAADIMASHTPEQGKAEMAAWMEWAQRAGSAIVDLGTPLRIAREPPGAGPVLLPASAAPPPGSWPASSCRSATSWRSAVA